MQLNELRSLSLSSKPTLTATGDVRIASIADLAVAYVANDKGGANAVFALADVLGAGLIVVVDVESWQVPRDLPLEEKGSLLELVGAHQLALVDPPLLRDEHVHRRKLLLRRGSTRPVLLWAVYRR